MELARCSELLVEQWTVDGAGLGGGCDEQDVWLKAADSTALHSWFMWPKSWADGVLATKPCVIFFQASLLARHAN